MAGGRTPIAGQQTCEKLAHLDEKVLSAVLQGMRKTSAIPDEILSSLRFGVTIADPREPDAPLIAVSEEFVTMTEYVRDEAIGKNCRFLNVDCELQPEVVYQLRSCIATGAPFEGLVTNRKKSGKTFLHFLDIRGLTVARCGDTDELGFLVGIHSDVSVLREAAELETYMKDLHAVIRSVQDGIRGDLAHILGSSTVEDDGLQMQSPRWVNNDVSAKGQEKDRPSNVSPSTPKNKVAFGGKGVYISETQSTTCSGSPACYISTKSSQHSKADIVARQLARMDRKISGIVSKMLKRQSIGTVVPDLKFGVTLGNPQDDACRYMAVSGNFARETGYSPCELTCGSCRFLNFQCNVDEESKMVLRMASDSGASFRGTMEQRKKTGELYLNYLDTAGLTLAQDTKGSDLWFNVAFHADVSELANSQGEVLEHDLDQLRAISDTIRSEIVIDCAKVAWHLFLEANAELRSKRSLKEHYDVCRTPFWRPGVHIRKVSVEEPQFKVTRLIRGVGIAPAVLGLNPSTNECGPHSVRLWGASRILPGPKGSQARNGCNQRWSSTC